MPNSLTSPQTPRASAYRVDAICLPFRHGQDGKCDTNHVCLILDDEGAATSDNGAVPTFTSASAAESETSPPMTMPATLERAPDTMVSLPTEKTSELPPLPHTQRVKIIYAGEGAATPGTRARLIRRRGGELVTEPLYVDVMPNRSVAMTIGDLFQVNQCGVPCTLYVLIAEQAGVLPETRAQVERMLQSLPDPVSIFVD